MTDFKSTIEEHQLTEDDMKSHVSHPDLEGETIKPGEEIYGHATIFEGEVVALRLFKRKSRGMNNFNESPHPYGDSIFFKGEIDETLELGEIEIIAKDLYK